jgi:hypothetical protein
MLNKVCQTLCLGRAFRCWVRLARETSAPFLVAGRRSDSSYDAAHSPWDSLSFDVSIGAGQRDYRGAAGSRSGILSLGLVVSNVCSSSWGDRL